MSALRESERNPRTAEVRDIVSAGAAYSRRLRKGQVLRIVDLKGNQAVDTLFYNDSDPSDRYSAVDTVREQSSVYLTSGTKLLTQRGHTLLTIIADTCGRHDTLGGACSAESNQVRYSLDKKFMHNCRDNFLLELAKHHPSLGKRDITCNINFFMNVPLTPDGGLSFEDGISAPGRYVELRAEMDVLLLVSNCPQLNNPCNAYNPTPIEIVVWKTP